jgi:hypothetical protein
MEGTAAPPAYITDDVKPSPAGLMDPMDGGMVGLVATQAVGVATQAALVGIQPNQASA